MKKMFQAGVGRAVITPEKGIALAGYFNPRYNTGKRDDLFAKALLLQKGESRLALVSCDLCFVTPEIVADVRGRLLREHLGEWAEHLLLTATHTHTGPYTAEFFGEPADEKYLDFLARQIADAVKLAVADLADAELLATQSFSNPLAFNRRYWMKDGRVVTNPGKLNPNIVRPEGPVDAEIGLLAIRKAGKIAAVVANIVNHTDTMGGDLVSADWPGFMEQALRAGCGENFAVLTLIGCSGNINHFDVSDGFDQTSPDEARRIGASYAAILAAMMPNLKKIDFAEMRIKRAIETVSYCVIDDVTRAEAEATMKRTEGISSDKDLTSEELAAGDGAVARFFAWQTLEYAKQCSGKARDFELFCIQFDDALAIATFPGECFTEIGLALKAGSPAKQTLIATLAMGECGYVCMPGCFVRGGYEILPVVGGGPARDTAPRLVKTGLDLLWR